MSDPCRTRRPRRLLVGIGALAIVLGPLPGELRAHEGIAASDPEMGAELDDPISEATIDFGEEIADDVEMALLYDTGDGEIEEVESDVTKAGPTTGRIAFDPLAREGRYFVRYLATVPVDGHVVTGAITFDFGEPRGSGAADVAPWVAFGVASVAILAVGAWFSRRRHLALAAGGSGEDDAVAVGRPGDDGAPGSTADHG